MLGNYRMPYLGYAVATCSGYQQAGSQELVNWQPVNWQPGNWQPGNWQPGNWQPVNWQARNWQPQTMVTVQWQLFFLRRRWVLKLEQVLLLQDLNASLLASATFRDAFQLLDVRPSVFDSHFKIAK